MDQFRDDTMMINDLVMEIEADLLQHKEKLLYIFDEAKDLQRELILPQFVEILKNWKTMIKAQGILINRMEQQTLINTIEVGGLPEEYAKDTDGVALILRKLLRISIDESYIEGFKRLGDIDINDPNFENRNPRPLVIQLIDQNIKNRILTVAESVVLSVIGSDRPMYITEHLTDKNNELLKKARAEALRHDINNVWTENGKIYVRRSNASLKYEIKCDMDIKNMAQY